MIKSQADKLADICLPSQGWMLHPKLQQLVAFGGRYLHGAVWGKCFREGRRITLMMAFWETFKYVNETGPDQRICFQVTICPSG